jgi:2-keto-4-pentenoate hydratase/2-oxohepta-3-ene-1,7-dioic acid hydratase in catechol pathway
MKLVRFGEIGRERPGLVAPDGRIHSLDGHIRDVDAALVGDAAACAKLAALDVKGLPLAQEGARLGCPIAGIGKIVGIGLNYHDHARECGAAIPQEPIVFLKATTSLAGPDDDIRLPAGSQKTDWEVELGVVIGRKAQNVALSQALDHVFGYCVAHDVSERAHQLERGGQWTKGKSHDTFCPLGPWLVTADEVGDPQRLRMWCDVNGVRRQDSATGDMIFPVAEIVSYVSGFMTLLPGDLLITGTPAGVGLGQKPPFFLKRGDGVALGIEKLGEQRQRVA